MLGLVGPTTEDSTGKCHELPAQKPTCVAQRLRLKSASSAPEMGQIFEPYTFSIRQQAPRAGRRQNHARCAVRKNRLRERQPSKLRCFGAKTRIVAYPAGRTSHRGKGETNLLRDVSDHRRQETAEGDKQNEFLVKHFSLITVEFSKVLLPEFPPENYKPQSVVTIR